MDRSRSSKRYYYDHQDYDYNTMDNRTTKHRHHHHSFNNHHRRKPHQDPLMVTTSYRILCHDSKVGSVIGKSGSIIKAIRQHTGAWISVHDLLPGDHEKIIEVSDTRRRDPDGRMPTFSPAQEALMLINERIMESDGGGGYNGNLGHDDVDDDDVYGSSRLVSRLVVSRMHVGCLLGKGGKIIEQMRKETKTLIRILPRDHTIPRCVDMSEEVVQVVGDINSVKNAVDVITSRLRESQHRDRSHFQNRLFPPEEDFMHHSNNMIHRSSMDGPNYGSRLPAGWNGSRSFNHGSRASGYGNDIGASPVPGNAQSLYAEDLVFIILCPNNKVDNVIGQPNGLIDLLQNEIGVEVRVADHAVGSDEQIIIVSSDEGPDDDLFPAQEALLHIQTRILDLVPDKENIITTRLLLSAGEAGCLDGRDGFLTDTKKMTGADIQILPRENLPQFVSVNEELVQIVGEIKAAREALIEVTLRLRSYLFQKDGQPSALLAPSPVRSASNIETASNNNTTPRETYTGNDKVIAPNQTSAAPVPAKINAGSNSEAVKLTESGTREDAPSSLNRITMPMITRSTLEVVIPEYAVPKLITKSRNKLAQISELSGADVKLIGASPEATENIIRISGTREQAERAQSLLQGFILSSKYSSSHLLVQNGSVKCAILAEKSNSFNSGQNEPAWVDLHRLAKRVNFFVLVKQVILA